MPDFKISQTLRPVLKTKWMIVYLIPILFAGALVIVSKGPVRHVATHVSWEGNVATISWETDKYFVADIYEVQRSFDNEYFETIDQLDATEMLENPFSYAYIDKEVGSFLEPTVYYRIKQVYKNGKTVLSKTTELENFRTLETE